MYRWDVFIAYASPDRAVAEALYQGLQAFRDAKGQPLKVCVDFKVSLPGDRWMRELPAHLTGSQVVVVLCSKQAAEGADYLEDEVAGILDRRERDRPERRVVPVLLEEDAELLYGLKGRQAIDGRAGIAAVLSALQRLFPQSNRQTATILDAYLDSLEQFADRLPAIFQPGGTANRAFSEVRVQVECRFDQERSVEGPLGEGKNTRLRLEQVLDQRHRHWLLLGKPGSGKSTLLHDLVLQVVKARREGGALGAWLPVLLRLAEVFGGLKDALKDNYPPGSWGLVEDAIRERRLLLLLDGLDEAGRTGGERVRSLLKEVPQCPVILSSRITDCEAPTPAFRALLIQELQEEEQRRLLKNWLGPEAMAEAILHIKGRKSLREMAGNPLLLTLMGLVFRESRQALPERRGDLYLRAVNLLLDGAHRRQEPRPIPKEERSRYRRLLGRAAFHLHGRVDLVSGEADQWSTSRFSEALAGEMSEVQAGDFLEEVSREAGLLEPRRPGRLAELGDRPQPVLWLFAHRTFQEFLAAEELGRRWRVAHEVPLSPAGQRSWHWFLRLLDTLLGRWNPWKSTVESRNLLADRLQKALESPAEWSEVLALSCGQLGDQADALVRRLLSEPHPTLSAEELEKKRSELLARVVAEAEGLSTDTVLAALQVDRAGSAWYKRKEKIEQLSTLLGEPEKVLALLQGWLPHTRNGNDLWFIREELRKLARGEWSGAGRVEEEVRQRAATEAAGIFRYLKGEDLERAAGIIRWIDVPAKGGKLEFLMGSPHSEKGRLGGEGPQHLVRFASGFAVMETPVTTTLYECFDPEHRADREDFGGKLAVGLQDDGPAYNLTWYEAQMFSEWIGTHPDHTGSRLPVEAEWEFFCRAGSSTAYHSGATEVDLKRAGWYDGNSGDHPWPVRQKEPNAWGLYDCHGNVWEWCLDEREPYRDGALDLDPRDLRSCPTLSWDNTKNIIIPPSTRRVIRGGSWLFDALLARSAFRSDWLPDFRVDVLGFRLVRPPQRD